MALPNVVVVGGTVRNVFDERRTSAGLSAISFLMGFNQREKGEDRIFVDVLGDDKGNSPIGIARELEEGDTVVVQGSVRENSWKKDDETEWNRRIQITASKLEVVSSDMP